ncbi:MAG: hypothetical protein RLZ55_1218 [Actinomycetota bacterium]|jgi:predicted ferric reductase
MARPRRSRLLGTDVLVVTLGVPLTALLLWWFDGGAATMSESFGGILTGLGQLGGLAAGIAALGGLALAARPASLERRYGLDRMLGWHRWTGMIAAFALLLHVVALVWAYSMRSGASPWGEIALLFGEAWMPAAMAAGALMALVSLSSWRRIKNRMAYETWYYLHVLGYLSVALALGHVLVQGSDFADNAIARAWWIALYVLVGWLIVYSRLRPLLVSLTHPVKVTGMERLSDGAVSIWLGGRGLRRQRAAAGQYYSLRFGVRGLWWQSHPYSVSAAPFADGLRFTFDIGDDARDFARIKVGTRVWLEGPYGTFTAERAGNSPVLLIGGGSGVAPIRAILEDTAPWQRPVVIVRVSKVSDGWFLPELQQLVTSLGGRLHVVAGSRVSLAPQDPLGASALTHLVPDLRGRTAFICGPTGMTRAATRGLRAAGLPASAIHTERYVY